MGAPPSLPVRLYVASEKAIKRLFLLQRTLFNGFWLGILSRETLDQVDALYYSGVGSYRLESYNKRGLWEWEQECLEQFFSGCRSILVAAAGGGREVYTLQKLGYDAHGFECNPDLVRFANELLEKEGLPSNIALAPRDVCPPGPQVFDGLIVGWGGYMCIQGRANRIAFLRQMRARARDGAPILVSFFAQEGSGHRFTAAARIANAFRRLLRRDRVDVGDWLVDNYVHFFSQDRIYAELRDGGFEPVYFSTNQYGHAVGRAMPDA